MQQVYKLTCEIAQVVPHTCQLWCIQQARLLSTGNFTQKMSHFFLHSIHRAVTATILPINNPSFEYRQKWSRYGDLCLWHILCLLRLTQWKLRRYVWRFSFYNQSNVHSYFRFLKEIERSENFVCILYDRSFALKNFSFPVLCLIFIFVHYLNKHLIY